ncbi:MAG TPA: alpha/beta hydrolase family protein [Candidatus Nitrosopolaris sp.]|nr:alpha/beta hydrolase family protein [Candidatus Nitrosopolaris sp.]
MRAQPDGAFEPPGTSDAILPPRSRLELLMARAAGRLDRFVLERFIRRHMLTSPRDGDELRQRLVRAREFYADHDFIAHPDRFFAPPTSLRTQLQHRHALRDGELLEVTYESDFVSVFPEERSDPRPNRAGVARWWRHRRPGHPAMLCVHGYGGGHLWLERLAFDAGRFYRAGLDVVLYVLPYHGLRSPHGARHSGALFFDIDLVRTNEAFAQAIYELRALLRYLRTTGTGPVGAFGMSLGAYVTALLATVESELAFAVPMIPLTSLAEMMWGEGVGSPRLALAIEHGWTLALLRDVTRVHAPLVREPLVPRERRLIIAALGDRICPPAHADALWRHWGRPRIHWYPGGHLAQFRRYGALREVRSLLTDAGLLPT